LEHVLFTRYDRGAADLSQRPTNRTEEGTLMKRSTCIALLTGKAVLGASIAIGFASTAAPVHVAHAADYPEPPAPVWIEGIDEDDARWDCRTMGRAIARCDSPSLR
jgi:hypothetical protein